MAVDSRKTLLITDLDPTVFGKITIGNKCYVSIPTMSGSGFNSLFRYSIRDLGDVSNDAIPVENNILAFKNGKWVSSVIDSTFKQNLDIKLNDITDVNLNQNLAQDSVLSWDGISNKWIPKAITSNQDNNNNVYVPERIKFVGTAKGQTEGVFVVSTTNEIYQSGVSNSVYNYFTAAAPGGTTDRLVLSPFSEEDGPVDGSGWKKVLFNNRNCYALTVNGQLWAKGFNDCGQLGVGTKVPVTANSKTDVFRLVSPPSFIAGSVTIKTVFEDIDISWSNPTALRSQEVVVAAICRKDTQSQVPGADRYLFVWGNTFITEANGIENTPKRISNFDALKPIKVSLGMSGATHYTVLCEDGKVFTAVNRLFGDRASDRTFNNTLVTTYAGNPLGRSHTLSAFPVSSFNEVSYDVTPVPIIKDIYNGCGAYFQTTTTSSYAPYTMLIDNNDKLYYAGRNNTGQAGIGTKTTIATSTSASGQGAFVACINSTTNGQLRVKSFGINDGAFHFAHIEKDTEKLVTLGSNIGNQLGTLGAANMVTSAYSIVNMPLSGETIKKVITGSYATSTGDNTLSGMTMVLTNNGLVYTFGHCPNGQSGNGRLNPALPAIVPMPEPIFDITMVGADQESAIFVLGNSGRGYVWGANNKGQTGALPPSIGSIPYPINVPIPQ
jgi:alpha-tubulin suppressor-like RCC1 family protein